jgi:hypothetical protein
MRIGSGELKTYWSAVPGMGFSWGGPLMVEEKDALVRSTVACCGTLAAMTAEAAWGVPGTDAFMFSLGLPSGTLAKSGGSDFPGTWVHGPFRSGAENQRPVTSR